MNNRFKCIYQALYFLICFLIALMQVMLPLFFIIYNSINQDFFVMKKMAIVIIIIEILSVVFLLFPNKAT